MSNFTTLVETSDADTDDYLLLRQSSVDYKQTRDIFNAAVVDNTTVDERLATIGMGYYTVATDTGSTNAINITLTNTDNVPELKEGMRIRFIPAYANTSSSVTVTFNGGSSATLYDYNGDSLASGAYSTDYYSEVEYRDSAWYLVNPMRLAAERTISISGDASGSVDFDGSEDVDLDLTVSSAASADTATKLTTARTISLSGDASGSASFNGTSNVSINATVSSSASADEATKLATARTITISGDASGSTTFDGSANKTIDLTVNSATSADQAAKLTNTRTISLSGDASGSVSFNGASNVTLATTVNSSAEADALSTARTITLSGAVSGSTTFDGSSNKTISTSITSSLEETIFEGTYPIGSFYWNYSNSANPSTYLIGASGSTWIAVTGRTVIGVGGVSDVNGTSTTYTQGETGGELEHFQTEEEVGSHTHPFVVARANTNAGRYAEDANNEGNDYSSNPLYTEVNQDSDDVDGMNVVQPYITAYIWRRTA